MVDGRTVHNSKTKVRPFRYIANYVLADTQQSTAACETTRAGLASRRGWTSETSEPVCRKMWPDDKVENGTSAEIRPRATVETTGMRDGSAGEMAASGTILPYLASATVCSFAIFSHGHTAVTSQQRNNVVRYKNRSDQND